MSFPGRAQQAAEKRDVGNGVLVLMRLRDGGGVGEPSMTSPRTRSSGGDEKRPLCMALDVILAERVGFEPTVRC